MIVTTLLPTIEKQREAQRRQVARLVFFSAAINRDPAVVAAQFTVGFDRGQEIRGYIYRDGSCSCANYKTAGDCRHAQAWQSLSETEQRYFIQATNTNAIQAEAQAIIGHTLRRMGDQLRVARGMS